MSTDSPFLINHELRSHGFASLGEAGALIPQLAFCVRDDRHLRTLINACDPEHRRSMYDALTPHLRFKARPLDVYIAELGRDAEIRQLPTTGSNGQLLEYKVPEIKTAPPADAEICAAAVTDAIAKQRIRVVCPLCTREAVFSGPNKEDVIDQLRAAGWRFARKGEQQEQVEVCPKCVAARAPRLIRA